MLKAHKQTYSAGAVDNCLRPSDGCCLITAHRCVLHRT